MDFFSSIEFYVIMVVVAASIIAMSARPRMRGSMREFLLASRLRERDEDDVVSDGPEIEFYCDEGCRVTLKRRGLPDDVTMSGAVSLAVSYDGVNLRCEERLTAGLPSLPRVAEAVFDFDFLGQGWYDAIYNSDSTGLFVAFKLHVRRGLRVTRPLQQ